MAESTGLTAGTKETPGWEVETNQHGRFCAVRGKELWIERVKMRITLRCWSGAESRDVNSGFLSTFIYIIRNRRVCVCVCMQIETSREVCIHTCTFLSSACKSSKRLALLSVLQVKELQDIEVDNWTQVKS